MNKQTEAQRRRNIRMQLMIKHMQEPITVRELASRLDCEIHNIDSLFHIMRKKNKDCIKTVGYVPVGKYRAGLYQITNKEFEEIPPQEVPIGHYIHDPDSDYFIDLYAKQAKENRKDRKSPRVYVGSTL